MAAIGKVSLRGIVHDDFQYTFNVKASTVVAADAGVKAVSVDTAAANQVKLAADANRILGLLGVYENRVAEGIEVGTVLLQGGYTFTMKASPSGPEMPAVGDFIVGAGAGLVRKATTAELALGDKSNWQVVEIAADNLTVVAIKV